MLRVSQIDLPTLGMVLEDHSGDLEGYLDSTTGEIFTGFYGDVIGPAGEPVDPEEQSDWVSIHDFGSSRDAYDDMVRFTGRVTDPGTRDELEQALQGKGAFRRFRNTISRYEESLGRAWIRFSDLRREARAITWLLDNDLVDVADAERVLAELAAACDEALADAAEPRGLTLDVADVPRRWAEAVRAAEAGEPVTIARDGEPWATLRLL